MEAKAPRTHPCVDAEQEALPEVVRTGMLVPDARRTFLPDADAWEAFDNALNRPARDVPGLRELLTTPTVLDPAT